MAFTYLSTSDPGNGRAWPPAGLFVQPERGQPTAYRSDGPSATKSSPPVQGTLRTHHAGQPVPHRRQPGQSRYAVCGHSERRRRIRCGRAPQDLDAGGDPFLRWVRVRCCVDAEGQATWLLHLRFIQRRTPPRNSLCHADLAHDGLPVRGGRAAFLLQLHSAGLPAVFPQ